MMQLLRMDLLNQLLNMVMIAAPANIVCCAARFANGMQARHELLQDLAELVQAREEKRWSHVSSSSNNSTTTTAHKSVFDYSMDDMRALVSEQWLLQ